MKKIIALLLLLPSFTCIAANVTESEAPAFSLASLDKGQISLSQFKGKVVYLDFWASWCGPCKQSFPWMNAMQEKFKSQGLEVVAVNLDENVGDANKFLAGTPAKFTVAFDAKGQIPRQYGVKGMPTSYLIDREGKIVYQHMGFNAKDRDVLEQKIRETLESCKSC